ncbi:YchJ family protein [Rhodococcus sp. NPDC049939]|uniref:YchJ family protein n=1 Tax=Rhodococcus sp. NPDC049939 TaxID=3155511 RepID=UPI0033C3189B
MIVRCPCLLGESYDDCCGRYHRGEAKAPTAERLMRSRFSAFALSDIDYLSRTWHPSTRPAELHLDPGRRWTSLEILAASGGGLFDTTGTVEFRAHYVENGRPGSHLENSRFVRVDGDWLYVDALATPGTRLPRL